MKIFVILKIQHAISWSHKLLNILNSWKNNKNWELHIFIDNHKNAKKVKLFLPILLEKIFQNDLEKSSVGLTARWHW